MMHAKTSLTIPSEQALKAFKSMSVSDEFMPIKEWLIENKHRLFSIVIDNDEDRPVEKGEYRTVSAILQFIDESGAMLRKMG